MMYVERFPLNELKISGDSWLHDTVTPHERHRVRYVERLTKALEGGLCDPVHVYINADNVAICNRAGATRAYVAKEILRWDTIKAVVSYLDGSTMRYDGEEISTPEQLCSKFRWPPTDIDIAGEHYMAKPYQYWSDMPLLDGENELPIPDPSSEE